jgi:molybdopterin-guanine dinucleotide biosynthesis protein B
MRVFAVAGYSSTGKTTLVEALIRELTRRGYSVSTIKSTNEEIKDMKGTDRASSNGWCQDNNTRRT